MHLQGPCDVKWGPVFSTSRQASRRKDFVVLVPDEAFLTGLPWAHIQPWKELQVCARWQTVDCMYHRNAVHQVSVTLHGAGAQSD